MNGNIKSNNFLFGQTPFPMNMTTNTNSNNETQSFCESNYNDVRHDREIIYCIICNKRLCQGCSFKHLIDNVLTHKNTEQCYITKSNITDKLQELKYWTNQCQSNFQSYINEKIKNSSNLNDLNEAQLEKMFNEFNLYLNSFNTMAKEFSKNLQFKIKACLKENAFTKFENKINNNLKEFERKIDEIEKRLGGRNDNLDFKGVTQDLHDFQNSFTQFVNIEFDKSNLEVNINHNKEIKKYFDKYNYALNLMKNLPKNFEKNN